MKTEWNYSELAKSYLKRPDYSDKAIDKMLEISHIVKGNKACDIGAGTAHLTLKLEKKGLVVSAVEPNNEMRELGSSRTRDMANVCWFEGTGEETKQQSSSFDIVTYGSSFNVMDRGKAMIEGKRIAKDQGWFAVMWNHRDLEDPVQKEIEQIINKNIKNYNYGVRREDQTEILQNSNLFKDIFKIEEPVWHEQSKDNVLEAWYSHATLQRQAGDKFVPIVKEIEKFLNTIEDTVIKIPYMTRIWLAQFA